MVPMKVTLLSTTLAVDGDYNIIILSADTILMRPTCLLFPVIRVRGAQQFGAYDH